MCGRVVVGGHSDLWDVEVVWVLSSVVECSSHDVASALVGQGNDYRQHPGLAGLLLDKKNENGSWDSVGNNCNRDDLCCDGDAIVLAETLENGNDSNVHLLSATLREYYNDTSKLANRFKQIA